MRGAYFDYCDKLFWNLFHLAVVAMFAISVFGMRGCVERQDRLNAAVKVECLAKAKDVRDCSEVTR